MRKISDTIARLAAQKVRSEGYRGRKVGNDRLRALPNFGSNPGALDGSCYVPKALPADSPLVVVLHGCTQTAAGYDLYSGWSRLAEEAGFALLYPEQKRGNNPNLCFNWFIPGDTQRHSGEVHSIRQMIETVVVAHDLDRRRIFITGLSAGGAMAAAMLATHPEVFAGGAIIAGLAHGIASTVPDAFDRMRGHGIPSEADLQRYLREASDHVGPWPKMSIWQGTADKTVAPSNAEALASQWRGVHHLDRVPDKTEAAGPLRRQIWCNGSGETVIEVNMIAGMGHGTPISGELGIPGPFMLDNGICSTRKIAAFWGLAGASSDEISIPSSPAVAQPRAYHSGETEKVPGLEHAAVHPRPSPPHPSAVQKTIEDALRAAGLMR